MKNIVYNEKDLEFLENNLNEISDFIGDKKEYYIKIFKNEKNSFNSCAWFFGPFWLGYRKMYIELLVVFVIMLALSSTSVSQDILNQIAMIGGVFLGIYGNSLYFMSIKRKIKKIKEN